MSKFREKGGWKVVLQDRKKYVHTNYARKVASHSAVEAAPQINRQLVHHIVTRVSDAANSKYVRQHRCA